LIISELYAKGKGEAWFVVCVVAYGGLKYYYYGLYAKNKNFDSCCFSG
jgi:hypothetical protein